MSDWEVQIDGGNPMWLHQLAGRNDMRGHFSLWGGVDDWLDCRNDYFSFSSLYFKDIQGDYDLAWQIAHELMSIFNGAFAIFSPGFIKFRVSAVLHNGKNTSYVEKRNALALLGPLPSRPTRSRAVEETDEIFRVVALACEQKDAYFITKLFEQEGNWTTYYKILETIESFTTIHGLDIKIDKTQKKSFELTANNFSLTHFDSRHGFKQQVKEIKTPAMTIESAYKFISNYAVKYLVARYGYKLGGV